jgi:dihydroorotase-like cyclic amidohydrolase
MQVDTVITNAQVVTPTGLVNGGVGIKDEKIACIFGGDASPPAGQTVDLAGQYLLPGLVDCHSHHGTYRSFADDIRLNSAASVVGGVTTMGVMTKVTNMRRQRNDNPTANDVVSYLRYYDEAEDVVTSYSSADAAFIFSIMTDDQAREVTKYAEVAGVNTFKFYFGYRDPRIWQAVPATLGLPVHWDDGTAYLAFKQIANIGGLALCHAECNELVRVLVEDTWKSGRQGLEAWNDKSPGFVEAHDIRTIGSLSQWTGAAFYIVHCSSLESVGEIKRCKEDGLDVTAETQAHYLTFALDDDPPAGGNWAKVNTPIRTMVHREALWDAIGSGVLDTLATDNVGGSAQLLEKNRDIWHCRPGFECVQFTLPVMMSHVAAGRLSIEKLVEMGSTNGARALRLYPRKGAIQIGSDADLVAVDPGITRVASATELISETDYSIYEGRELAGWPTATWLRGQVVARGGKLVVPYRGIPLRRT